MPNTISLDAVPSLIEVLKKLAKDRRGVYDQLMAIPIPDAGDEESPEAKLMEELDDRHSEHPLLDLFRLIEEETGISRGLVEQLATRVNTPLGAAPLKRTPRPRRHNPDLDGFLDDDPKPDLPDLRPLYRKLNKCDVNGTTATIMRRFEAKHTGVLASHGIATVSAVDDAIGSGTTSPKGIVTQPMPDDGVIFFLGERQYRIDNWPTITVTENEDTVLQAFLSQSSIDGPALERKAGFDRATRVLRELCEKYDRRFTSAITLPGNRGAGGYAVKIRDGSPIPATSAVIPPQ